MTTLIGKLLDGWEDHCLYLEVAQVLVGANIGFLRTLILANICRLFRGKSTGSLVEFWLLTLLCKQTLGLPHFVTGIKSKYNTNRACVPHFLIPVRRIIPSVLLLLCVFELCFASFFFFNTKQKEFPFSQLLELVLFALFDCGTAHLWKQNGTVSCVPNLCTMFCGHCASMALNVLQFYIVLNIYVVRYISFLNQASCTLCATYGCRNLR